MFGPRWCAGGWSGCSALGHLEAPARPCPRLPQLLVAARDQMVVSATEETRLFYRSQGIPWVFHNLRRFVSGPATMLDPMGLFSPRETIVHHVLQTFHRHPVYDLVLLRAHPGGLESLEAQTAALLAGHHPHQRALSSLIEDGSYHARLPAEIAAFAADPLLPARPIPPGLLPDPMLMLAMDQFKDIARLRRLRRPPARRLGGGHRRLAGGGLRRDGGRLAGDQARPAPGGAGRL